MITKIAEDRRMGHRLVRGHPMLEAEVVYTAHNEYCETVVDFIARRTRLGFLDTRAARQAVGRVSPMSKYHSLNVLTAVCLQGSNVWHTVLRAVSQSINMG